MPRFRCPITNCTNWSEELNDCKFPQIMLESRSDDYDVTLACNAQGFPKEDWS